MSRRSHLRCARSHASSTLYRDVILALGFYDAQYNIILCFFRCPVHSHLRRAPEGPEQVPHVPGTCSGPSGPWHGYGSTGYDDKRTPRLYRPSSSSYHSHRSTGDEINESPFEWASTLHRITQRVRKTISLQREINEQTTSAPNRLPTSRKPLVQACGASCCAL